MNIDKLQQIRIEGAQRQRSSRPYILVFATVLIVTAAAAYFAMPGGEDRRVFKGNEQVKADTTPAPVASAAPPAPKAAAPAPDASGFVLTVSGYIVNRERIEISPRFLGMVKWIGVKKGDTVKKDDVIVQLDDAEQRARLLEIEGQLTNAEVAVEQAKLTYDRVQKLRATQNETVEREDEARLRVASAEATLKQIRGLKALAEVQLDWTTIRAPINGVVLEKLADPGELVTPQSFGGTRGPSTALVALADPKDLQVEIDLNEADLPKIRMGQRCRVTPEAYPDKHYGGYVAEIAPEANRQKGTLEIKVQIENPDQYLTPELSARVDFLA
ncbi:MAG: efflux RND transporter periplasmic adaptor subunit, partial [Chthoniobacteraceae bacterium]